MTLKLPGSTEPNSDKDDNGVFVKHTIQEADSVKYCSNQDCGVGKSFVLIIQGTVLVPTPF